MAAFSCQNRPAAAYARPVEGAPVLRLPTTIVIVSTPARPLRQVIFEYPIDHFDGVAHDRIIQIANAEPYEMKKIAAHYISRRMEAATVGDLDQRCVWIGVSIGRVSVGGINADVVTRKTRNQVTPCCDRPFFDVRCQPVSIRENKIRKCRLAAFFAVLPGAD